MNIKFIFRKFFGTATGFVEMISQHIPSPLENGANKVKSLKLAT